MIILIDQDGPLADFEHGFLEKWRATHPDLPSVPFEQRRAFYARDDYPHELRSSVESIYFAPGFFRNLAPVTGGIEAVQLLSARGHDVRICTQPLSQYENCVLEKYQWVEHHLGRAFVDRMILTKDKTLVHGDLLIDDRPVIEGIGPATWEHIVFDCPYNRQAPGRRITWNTYRAVLGI